MAKAAGYCFDDIDGKEVERGIYFDTKKCMFLRYAGYVAEHVIFDSAYGKQSYEVTADLKKIPPEKYKELAGTFDWVKKAIGDLEKQVNVSLVIEDRDKIQESFNEEELKAQGFKPIYEFIGGEIRITFHKTGPVEFDKDKIKN